MARFAGAPTKARPGPSNIQGKASRTYEGGAGYTAGDPHVELFNAAVSGLLTDKFYESGDERVRRLVSLVPKCEPEWLANFTEWLRDVAHLRSAPIVIAAEYGRANLPHRRTVVASALKRPDEPGEMLGYWLAMYGRPIPSWLKRGVADAVVRLYSERSLVKWDGQGQAWRFGDVIEMVHPKPKAPWQADLFRYALDRRRHPDCEIPESLRELRLDRDWINTPKEARRARFANEELPNTFNWERLAGWLPEGMDAAAWEKVLPNMGPMALIRNLNNLDRAKVSTATRLTVSQRLTDPNEIKRSKLMPFRYLTAYKNLETDNYKVALNDGADVALANLPRIPGRTLIMVDCSGSMGSPVGGRGSRDPLRLSQLAGFMAEAVARACDDSMIVCYDTQPLTRHVVQPHVGVLTASATDVYTARGGTNTWSCAEWAVQQEHFDQVLILTDEQSHDRDSGSIRIPVVTWNLAGYSRHMADHGKPNRYLVSGIGDTPLQVLPSLLKRATGSWPWA